MVESKKRLTNMTIQEKPRTKSASILACLLEKRFGTSFSTRINAKSRPEDPNIAKIITVITFVSR
jgi:hypothetical protein